MDLAAAVVTTWYDDAWAGESYVLLTTAARADDDHPIAAPSGRVLLAPHHTAGAWANQLELAARWPRRAANETAALLALAERSPTS